MLSKEQAIEKLQRQSVLISDLKTKPSRSPEFKKWHRDTEVAIEKSFGSDTRHLKDFNNISYSPWALSTSTSDYEFENKYHRGLDEAREVIQSFIDELAEYDAEHLNSEISVNAINLVENTCKRFHIVSQQLLSRYNGRPTIEVKDEYDVQYVLHALLLLNFGDVRREDWTPSYAGGCSRVDFILKNENLVIEVKKTRKGLDAKHIGEQLMIDIQRYKAHPHCQTLICFVYDPEGRIANPRGLENDLNGIHQGISVIVMIAPSGV